jgi:hypothetical protein
MAEVRVWQCTRHHCASVHTPVRQCAASVCGKDDDNNDNNDDNDDDNDDDDDDDDDKYGVWAKL